MPDKGAVVLEIGTCGGERKKPSPPGKVPQSADWGGRGAQPTKQIAWDFPGSLLYFFRFIKPSDCFPSSVSLREPPSPKGKTGALCTSLHLPICPAEPIPWAVPFERGRCLRNFQENRNAIKRLAIFVAKGYNTPVNKNRGACDSRLRGSHQLRPFREFHLDFPKT